MEKTLKPIVLVVLDGWGEWDIVIGNPLKEAKLPTIMSLNQYYPKILLDASGLSVGLPWGVMGNSEVGHQTIGVGQIVFEASPTIDMAVQGGSFYKNKVLLNALERTKALGADLHLWGLVSDGGVHSKLEHLFALLKLVKTLEIDNVYIHAVTDGRDTPPRSAVEYINKLLKTIKALGTGKIATITGRYYIMDRNQNWERIEKAFLALTECQGNLETDSLEAIKKQYKNDVTDEYLEPIVMVDDSQKPVGRIKSGDTVICFNFRGDRARQLTQALTEPGFDKFKYAHIPEDIDYVGFTLYEKDLNTKVAFPAKEITTRVGGILSELGKTQLRIAETEKYAHVTYFFNGGLEQPFKNEERILIPSKNTPSYADTPEMSVYEITDRLIKEIETCKHDFILVNYANPDMVGHTGVYEAGVKAVEHVDTCLNRLIKAVLAQQGVLLVTADHGNIEEMINIETGEIDTKHSTNPVPCWLISCNNKRHDPKLFEDQLMVEGMLADVPVTVLDLFGIDKPKDMSGRSLIPIFKLK